MQLSLNPSLNTGAIAAEFAEAGRVRVPEFVDRDALKHVHAELVERSDWRELFIGDDGIVQRTRPERQLLDDEESRALDARVHERACLGFQYRYEGIRIPGADETSSRDPLFAVAEFLASPSVREALSTIVGHNDLRFGEGQATAYSAGDFLTCHDDNVQGRGRVAAFVLGLTPSWRPEWGGLLMFHSDDDAQLVAHVPRFNTLDLFAVPQRHSVSYVSPSAPTRRLALTGWLHSKF